MSYKNIFFRKLSTHDKRFHNENKTTGIVDGTSHIISYWKIFRKSNSFTYQQILTHSMLWTTWTNSDQIQIRTTLVQDTDMTCTCGILTSVNMTKDFYYTGINLFIIFPYQNGLLHDVKIFKPALKTIYYLIPNLYKKFCWLQIDKLWAFMSIFVFETNIILDHGMLHTRGSVIVWLCEISINPTLF
jgi:hypothetical protein